jgi:hypothetical protein
MVGFLGSIPILLGLKVDRVLDGASWVQILVPAIMVAGFLAFMGINYLALAANHVKNNAEPDLMTTISTILQGIDKLCFSLILTSILLRILVLDNITAIAVPTAVLIAGMLFLLVYPFRDELALYFAGAEIVGVLEPVREVRFEKVEVERVLYRVGDNWLGKEPGSGKAAEENRLKKGRAKGDVIQGVPSQECAVCLSEPSSMAWFPCGHLCLCPTCAGYLMENKKLACVMCKS